VSLLICFIGLSILSSQLLPFSSGLITVSPQARIDRDSNMNSFEIIVNAVDSGTPIPETATTTVYVNVKDINDERPKFEQNSYAAYVSERTAVGESVLR